MEEKEMQGGMRRMRMPRRNTTKHGWNLYIPDLERQVDYLHVGYKGAGIARSGRCRMYSCSYIYSLSLLLVYLSCSFRYLQEVVVARPRRHRATADSPVLGHDEER